MTTDGIFITFEGIDGAGKSTHIEALARALRAHDRVVTLTREPGGTALAEKLRQLVLHDVMDPMTESLLVFAARRDHLQGLIRPALARGEVVLCDRFSDATFAYQGSAKGFDVEFLTWLEQQVQAGTDAHAGSILQPDLTIWFDLPAQVAAERLLSARVPDKFESQPVDFFRRVSAGYAQRCATHITRFARIDAARPREAVWQAVLQAVRDRGWLG